MTNHVSVNSCYRFVFIVPVMSSCSNCINWPATIPNHYAPILIHLNVSPQSNVLSKSNNCLFMLYNVPILYRLLYSISSVFIKFVWTYLLTVKSKYYFYCLSFYIIRVSNNNICFIFIIIVFRLF